MNLTLSSHPSGSLSRIAGLSFTVFGKVEDLTEVFKRRKPQALVINLGLIRYGYPVLGYYSHVNSDMAKAAAEAGVRYLIARGAFSSDLIPVIRGLLLTES